MDRNKKGTLSVAIIKTWLIAGTLDISIALIQYYLQTGKDPANVLRYIAGGVFGKQAFSGGTSMAAFGLCFHYIIAFCWVALFFIIYPRFSFLKKSVVINAFCYGLLVWVVMTRVVLPLTTLPSQPFILQKALQAMLILVFAIGLPSAYFAKKYYDRR